MKMLFVAALFISSTAFAQDFCSRWRGNPRYDQALNSLSAHLEYEPNVMCSLPALLDIEVQPFRVIDEQGEVIPHVRIYLHRAYESCYYMVRDADQVITSGRCFSGF
ncbi:MAG: hypothetical protein NDI69_17955 [Bacteriovoracaceae bacterium]|nr:hypothetical protein [Bacteriovoracaceae bacterium]